VVPTEGSVDLVKGFDRQVDGAPSWAAESHGLFEIFESDGDESVPVVFEGEKVVEEAVGRLMVGAVHENKDGFEPGAEEGLPSGQ